MKYHLQGGIKKLNYLTDHILYQILKIILCIFLKRHGEKSDNPSISIYENKIENRITFKSKAGFYLKLLTPRTMQLLGSNNSKITWGSK